MNEEEKCQGPLSGYRILEMSTLVAASICGMLLADMGAEVIKVEPPRKGDFARSMGTAFHGGESLMFLSMNRNKLSLMVDLEKEEGRKIFYRLLPTVDAVIEGFRPSLAGGLQMDYEACRKVREDIIYLSLSGYGQTGPYARRPANDPLIQAVSGLMSLTGELGGPPMLAGNPASDFAGASMGVYALCAAFFHRERTGQGQPVEISLLDSMVYSIIPREGEVLATGREHERYGTGHPSFVPYQAFEAEDRKWFFLSCFTPKFWSNLCQAIGRPDLEKDPRFASNTDRVKNRQKLILLLEKIFRQKPMAEWIARIQEADVPCGPVNDLEMVMKDPQVVHNRMVASIDHPKMGMIRTMSHPIRFLGTPARLELPPPALGEHTTCILQEIGFTTAEIKDFKEKRVI